MEEDAGRIVEKHFCNVLWFLVIMSQVKNDSFNFECWEYKKYFVDDDQDKDLQFKKCKTIKYGGDVNILSSDV